MAIHTDCTHGQLVQLQMMPKVSTTSVEAENPCSTELSLMYDLINHSWPGLGII